VGYPKEYFDPAKWRQGACEDYEAFIARIVSENARNGVFGAKFVGDQLQDFLAALRALPGNRGLTDRAMLESALPAPRYVWLERRDVVAQAVSLCKARETGRWWVGIDRRSEAAPVPPVVFDFERIDRVLAAIVRGNHRWRTWFAENEIEPFRVVYEDLDESSVDVTKRVLAFLRIHVPEGLVIEAATLRQSGPADAELIARYRTLNGLPTAGESV
jgi:LPS sulfotransferase NodH